MSKEVKMKLLYVCNANKGRSPALEVLTRSIVDDKVNVSSAGINVDWINKQLRNPDLPDRATPIDVITLT